MDAIQFAYLWRPCWGGLEYLGTHGNVTECPCTRGGKCDLSSPHMDTSYFPLCDYLVLDMVVLLFWPLRHWRYPAVGTYGGTWLRFCIFPAKSYPFKENTSRFASYFTNVTSDIDIIFHSLDTTKGCVTAYTTSWGTFIYPCKKNNIYPFAIPVSGFIEG